MTAKYQKLTALVLATAFAALMFAIPGFDGVLLRDNSIYLYGGQQFAQGVLPYVSVFDHKGPGAGMICGTSIHLGSLLGFGDIESCRATFYGFAVLAAGMLYLLVFQLTHRVLLAVASVVAFSTFWGLVMHVASGPKPKVGMLLIEVTALYFASRKKWFWAAFFGACASLIWQPMGLICIAVFLACLAQDATWKRRARDAAIATLGGSLPVAVVVLVYALNGAIWPFIDGWVLFNFTHLDRGDMTVAGNIWHLGGIIMAGKFATSSPVFLMAAASFAWIYINLAQRKTAVLPGNQDVSAWLPVLLLPPALFSLSLIDFQGTGDVLPFLPLVAIGFALFLGQLQELIRQRYNENSAERSVAVIIALLGLTGLGYAAMQPRQPIETQISAIQAAEKALPETAKLITIGAPEYMALSRRTSEVPILFIINGIDNYIASGFDGDFHRWLDTLDVAGITHVVYGPTNGHYKPLIEEWLEENFTPTAVDKWTLYSREAP